MRTLADEMHSSIAMDVARIQYVLAGPIARIRVAAPHPSLDPRHIVIDDDSLVGVLPADEVSTQAPYAAPETIRSGQLTHESNVYSFGAILRALFDDRIGVPFAARELVQICLHDDPERRPLLTSLASRLAALQWLAPNLDARELVAMKPFVPASPNERELVKAIRENPNDAATRQVYADWLEENGFEHRSLFLRMEVGGFKDDERLAREQRPLAPRDEASWRAIVSTRVRVERCSSEHCPRRWHELTPTKHDNLRSCPYCDRVVHYCWNTSQAALHGHRREHIAIDASLTMEDVLGARVPRTDFEGPIVEVNPPAPVPPPTPIPPEFLVPHTMYMGNPPAPRRPVLERLFGWLKKR